MQAPPDFVFSQKSIWVPRSSLLLARAGRLNASLFALSVSFPRSHIFSQSTETRPPPHPLPGSHGCESCSTANPSILLIALWSARRKMRAVS